ncbi:hypothetical protein OC835_002080 [Tilletia horrida]|uniref:Deoxyribonuclease NucA/NucB domain-containing protein n=1 Tax=Tilletia horrida TaxID=155126 RepID=A0AAN6GHA8_9BASI|nr:hypothetical protein OC835_002080 [Tilletia horrida]KAK0540274.1 hypothetical protein OC842_000569 [Tilletia horrida]KAK0559009.1 hypothetical protein OC844_004709 [Tilletia horrida]
MLFRSLATALLASSAFAATVVFDCTKVPNICSNDCYAIQCAGKPTLLHRDSNDATYHRTQNACRSPNRCSGNPTDSNSCDEYPYASSAEGGAGAVTRCVPSHENSVQGGTLSSFYTNNGVTEGKAYNVGFSNSGGLQYCGTGCSNTGNEVIRRGEQGQRPGPQFLRRHFRSNEGHSILMFERWSEPGSLDHLVGSQVWLAHEERNVTITHAA